MFAAATTDRMGRCMRLKVEALSRCFNLSRCFHFCVIMNADENPKSAKFGIILWQKLTQHLHPSVPALKLARANESTFAADKRVALENSFRMLRVTEQRSDRR